MNPYRTVASILVLTLAAGGVAAAEAGADAVKLKNGVHCAELDAPDREATHRCWFVEQRVGRWDFASRNSRAQYVATELGPDCEEIEILGDIVSSRTSTDGQALREVAVACTE